MNLKKWIFIMSSMFILAGCTEENKIADIEGQNHHAWQKYMSEEEFNQIQVGMTYMDVVEIAKGRGDQQDAETYVWQDEVVLTHAYEIKFIDGLVTEKQLVERRGSSIRDREEKAPAQPGVSSENTEKPADQASDGS